MRSPAAVLACGAVLLAGLACGGSVGSDPADDMIVDLRFTGWECYEGGYYEGLTFNTDGRCDGSSGGWTCTYVQKGNEFTVEWASSDGDRETWSGLIIDPRGLEMGGTSLNGSVVNDFRCSRDL